MRQEDNCEWWSVKNLEGGGHVLYEDLFWNLCKDYGKHRQT
jgi:hypothetical protein